MPFHMKSVQMYRKVLNMEMNLSELAIYLNILNISKDCQRICGDFIFTAVCRVCLRGAGPNTDSDLNTNFNHYSV
jgi:hypothetical protein